MARFSFATLLGGAVDEVAPEVSEQEETPVVEEIAIVEDAPAAEVEDDNEDEGEDGYEEMLGAFQAVALERERLSKVFESPTASANPQLAVKLLTLSEMSAADIVSALELQPTQKASAFEKAMTAASNPDLGTGALAPTGHDLQSAWKKQIEKVNVRRSR